MFWPKTDPPKLPKPFQVGNWVEYSKSTTSKKSGSEFFLRVFCENCVCAEVLKVWWKLCVAGCRMLPVSTSPAAPTHHMLLIVIIFVIIIVTRPKPAYGRQGLAGSWGQDTDKVSNFWVFLTSYFAQLGIKPTWDHS